MTELLTKTTEQIASAPPASEKGAKILTADKRAALIQARFDTLEEAIDQEFPEKKSIEELATEALTLASLLKNSGYPLRNANTLVRAHDELIKRSLGSKSIVNAVKTAFLAHKLRKTMTANLPDEKIKKTVPDQDHKKAMAANIPDKKIREHEKCFIEPIKFALTNARGAWPLLHKGLIDYLVQDQQFIEDELDGDAPSGQNDHHIKYFEKYPYHYHPLEEPATIPPRKSIKEKCARLVASRR